MGFCRISPLIYALIGSVQVMTGPYFLNFSTLVVSFDASDVSAIDVRRGTTKSFHFADFPCPPPDVQWHGFRDYHPFVVPPPTFLDQMREISPTFPKGDCDLLPWIDPPSAHLSILSVNPPIVPSGKPAMALRQRHRPTLPLETGATYT